MPSNLHAQLSLHAPGPHWSEDFVAEVQGHLPPLDLEEATRQTASESSRCAPQDPDTLLLGEPKEILLGVLRKDIMLPEHATHAVLPNALKQCISNNLLSRHASPRMRSSLPFKKLVVEFLIRCSSGWSCQLSCWECCCTLHRFNNAAWRHRCPFVPLFFLSSAA